mmetsp:Transcript_44172/g.109781  ORF Transcript_44172/g.109781 Transcript_44172/m.109781 type:complete len:247 (+) Transcript_44172:664-1404(+)
MQQGEPRGGAQSASGASRACRFHACKSSSPCLPTRWLPERRICLSVEFCSSARTRWTVAQHGVLCHWSIDSERRAPIAFDDRSMSRSVVLSAIATARARTPSRAFPYGPVRRLELRWSSSRRGVSSSATATRAAPALCRELCARSRRRRGQFGRARAAHRARRPEWPDAPSALRRSSSDSRCGRSCSACAMEKSAAGSVPPAEHMATSFIARERSWRAAGRDEVIAHAPATPSSLPLTSRERSAPF